MTSNAPEGAAMRTLVRPVAPVPDVRPELSASPHRWRRALGRLAAGVAVTLAVSSLTWALAIEGWSDRWGATDAEVAAALPGDDLVTRPAFTTTRAVTVRAPAETVWPWIVQLGQGRGGLYTYDWVERLVGVDMVSAERILPQHQDLAVGDQVWVTQPGYPADLGMRVAALEPGRSLLLAFSTPSRPMAPEDTVWTWAFVLDPLEDGSTRLVVRNRNASVGPVGDAVWDRVVGPVSYAMERGMLRGVARRAEISAGVVTPWPKRETVWFAALVVTGVALLAFPSSGLPLRRSLSIVGALSAAATLVLLRWSSALLALALLAVTVALLVAAVRSARWARGPGPNGTGRGAVRS
jgi:hypothetical protein